MPERWRGRRRQRQTERHGDDVTSPEFVTPAASTPSEARGVVDEAQEVNPQPLVGFLATVGGCDDGGGSPEGRRWRGDVRRCM